jgi:alpha-galactosidase
MEDTEVAAWAFVAEDKSEVLLSVVRLGAHCNAPINYVRLKGLEEKALYVEEVSQKEYSGSALMHAGLPLPMLLGEYLSKQLHFTKLS